MKPDEKIRNRLAELIQMGDGVLATKRSPGPNVIGDDRVDTQQAYQWATSVQNLLVRVFGQTSEHCKNFTAQVDPGGRLFTQVNQSEILSEFLSVITSPLEPRSAHRRQLVTPVLPDTAVGAEALPSASPKPSTVWEREGRDGAPPRRQDEIDRNRLFGLITNWTFVTATMIAVIGIVLILLGGPEGRTIFTLFGQEFQSMNVGIAAIFIAVVMVILNIRRLLKSVDR